MKRPGLVMIVFVVGCGRSLGSYPIMTGDDDNSMIGNQDAFVQDTSIDGAALLTGKVCLLSDSRDVGSCATTGADGLTVKLGANTATAPTTTDGSFTIVQPPGSNLLWHITGPALQSTVVSFNGTATIPALTVVHFGNILQQSAAGTANLPQNTGSIFAHVVHASGASVGLPIAGVTVTATSSGVAVPEFDIAGTDGWDTPGPTGAFGMIWLPEMPAPSSITSITVKSGTVSTVVPGITVEDNSITYLVIAI